MANNTVLNPGVGGDTLKTDDLGTSKVPVSKIMLGGAGLDLGYVSGSNPLPTQTMSGSLAGMLVGGVALSAINPMPVALANSSNLVTQSGSVTGLLVGGVAAALSNPVPVTGSAGILVAGSPASAANPLPTKPQSGSLTAILLGGNASPVSLSNPMPVSGAVGLLVAGSPASLNNPVPTSGPEVGGQIMSGSTFRTVQYAFGDFASGALNQTVAAQGAGNRVRVISAFAIGGNAATLRWFSTGSAGRTNISGLSPVPANGGYVLPYNPHGWFQTNVNEALNLDVNTAGGTIGLTLTWILAGT